MSLTAPRRTLGPWAFAAVSVASFGGPLALAALNAPGIAAGASASAGLGALAGTLLFCAPMMVWLRYARHIHGAGGLSAFVEAAVGRRLALVQAAIWTASYLLYLIYTTVQIVYDLLPAVLPGERRYQSALTILIPLALAAVMLAGRTMTLLVFALLAIGQLVLGGLLDGLTLANLSTPVSSFAAGSPAGALSKTGAQTAQLYICGSLPLFLGGEVRRPWPTLRRGLLGAFGLTGLLVVLAVAPLAAAPGLTRTQVPGVSVAAEFATLGVTRAIGIGVAVSTAGIMLAEYLALTRLAEAVAGWRTRSSALAIGVITVLAAPLTLIDPQGAYNSLLEPSLVALWLSQLIVFAAYPRFARRFRQPLGSAWLLAAVSSGLAVYGVWTALQQSSS